MASRRSAIPVVDDAVSVHSRDRPGSVAVIRDRLVPGRPVRSDPADECRASGRMRDMVRRTAVVCVLAVDGSHVAEPLHRVIISRLVDAILKSEATRATGKSGGRGAGDGDNADTQGKTLQLRPRINGFSGSMYCERHRGDAPHCTLSTVRDTDKTGARAVFERGTNTPSK